MSTNPASQPASPPPAEHLDDGEVVALVEVVEETQPSDPASPSALSAEDPPRAAAPDPSLHWAMLLGAACVVVLAAVLQVRGPETVVIPLVDMPLPGTCTYKRFVGIECPGCGLTRCFISMAHGRPVAAWRFNPAGILFFTIVAAQIPFRGLQIWRIRRGMAEIQLGRFGHYVMACLIVALLTQWLIRTFFA